jgi:hypothetical protein
MKLKNTIFLAMILMLSALAVFAQTPTPKPEAKPEAKPTPAAKLPTVKEILDRYVQAVGGRAAIEKVQTRMMKGTVELAPMGVRGTVESYSAAPDKFYNKMTLGGIGDMFEGFDGKNAWASNPLQGNRDKTGDELAQTKINTNFHRELNFEKLYTKLEVKGIEKIGDKEAYVIHAVAGTLEPQSFYFDKQTGLLLREDLTAVSPEGKTPTKNYFEDYREVDGAKLPFKVRSVLPQFEVVVTVTEYKNGVTIDEKLFAKPKE